MRKRKLSPYTIAKAHVLLTNIFKVAARRGLILSNPMNLVDSPGKPEPSPVAMDEDQVKTFLDVASSTAEGFMFRFAFFLGARPCEYLGLKWSDVDFKAKTVHIQRSLKRRVGGEWYTTPPKTKKSDRFIALTDEFVKGLEDHKRRQLEMRLKARADWPAPRHNPYITPHSNIPVLPRIELLSRSPKKYPAELAIKLSSFRSRRAYFRVVAWTARYFFTSVPGSVNFKSRPPSLRCSISSTAARTPSK
jgi:integrase